MSYTIISYCNDTWPRIGGVARYDTQLKLIFPERVFFKGPQQKDEMLNFLKTCKKPIVITDNHLACDIPNEYPIILVHHGCALTTSERNPDWEPYWRDLCCNGQKQMLSFRNPENTWIISTCKSIAYDFNRYYPNLYSKFTRFDLLHPSEFDESKFKNSFNNKPIILGNWNGLKKGKHLFPKLSDLLPEFEFKQLSVMPEKNETLESFNLRKQEQYLQSDIFLQIANSEGCAYSSLDTMICGLIPICTNVGMFEFDVPKDSFVELDWKKCYGDDIDYDYLCNKIRHTWANKENLSKNARKWYMENCRFVDWEKDMKNIVNKFYNTMY